MGDLKAYDFDADQVAADHGVPVEYVRAALAYYERHPEIIDGRLAANNDDD
ncbi:MAG TPA: hypothetical protein VMV93_01000 [Chloroflexota bacterium]|nr:hypothetical protein [Chloroflexota bacterium]